jgi:hypothetical protein
MRLAALGRPGRMGAVAQVAPVARANRVTLARRDVEEWYSAGPLGVEQGFTLDRRPAGRGRTVSLVLRLGGTLGARQVGSQVRFRTRAGAASLRYGGLTALDAAGRRLPAMLAVHGRSLLVRVVDRGARYPVTVDPFVQQGPRIGPGDAAGAASFGWSVALSSDGDTALVGGSTDAGSVGAAWVFTRSGGTWKQQGQKLTANDENGGASFGTSVALSGDGNTALIGGPGDDEGSGAAWVFTRSDGTWAQQGSKLTPSDPNGNVQFGADVSLSSDGNTALIGGPNDGNGDVGAAWVFVRSGGAWLQQGSKLLPTDSDGDASFGTAVSLSPDGGTALIGGPFEDGRGAVWVFARAGSTWAQQGPKLRGTGEIGSGFFGGSVSLSGDGNTALVGGYQDNTFAGAAWAFTRTGSTWAQQGPKLTASDETPVTADQGIVGISRFGFDVALSGDGNTAVIGGPYDDFADHGAAWVFTRSGSTWMQDGSKLVPSDEGIGSSIFGQSVAVSRDGTTALGGAVQDPCCSGSGAVWAFTNGSTEDVVCGDGSSSALQVALGAAVKGETLVISGRCVGGFTVPIDLTLTGTPGATLDGAGANGTVLVVPSGVTATVTGLTITGGSTPAVGDGGGIDNSGTVFLNDSSVSGNVLPYNGGVHDSGGGIFNTGTMWIRGSTISGNLGGYVGGGIRNVHGTVTLVDSTVAENAAEFYSGIDNNVGTLALADSTVAANNGTPGPAGFPGDGVGINDVAPGTTTLTATIVAGNTANDCRSELGGADDFVSGGYNLIGHGTTLGTGCLGSFDNDPTNQIGVIDATIDPQLGALADNGGPTATMALPAAGSPAVDKVPEGWVDRASGASVCGGTVDQRGASRPEPGGTACDIGAFEAGGDIVSDLSLAPTTPTAEAGVAQVKLANIPPAALLASQSSAQSAPVNQTPVNQTPVNQTPVNQTPVNQTPVNQTPVNQTAATDAPVNQTPVNQTPVNQTGGSGFPDLALTVAQLGDIQLSTIPLLRPGGWESVLATTSLANLPLQTVTLGDVYRLDPLPEPLRASAADPITVGELDLSKSVLGTLPAMAVALGKVPLSALRTADGQTYTGWCTSQTVPGLDCTGSASVLSAGLEGAPVNQTPVNQTPVNQTLIDALAVARAPVNQTPVNQTPVNQTRIGALPVNQTPVNQTPVNQTPINALSLQAILAANAPVNQTPVNQTPLSDLADPDLVVDCTKVDCKSATLGAAYAAGAVKAVTLGDLRRDAGADGLTGWTIADLRDYGDMTIGDLLASLPQPNDFTLADVLLLVLGSKTGQQGLSFEGIDIFNPDLSKVASDGGTVGYEAQFSLRPSGGAANGEGAAAVTATLPSGFFYIPGSSTQTECDAGCASPAPIADPAATTLGNGRVELTWRVSSNACAGCSARIDFTVRPGMVLGPQTASLEATPAGGPTADTAGTSLTVGDTFEPNDDPATAPTISNDSLYLSYLTSASDRDYYRFPMPPAGTVVTFHLSHLPADYDLVVYGPKAEDLRPSLTPGIPLDEPPVTDNGTAYTHATDSLPSQTLDDLDLQPDMALEGVSANRGTDPEDVVVISPGGGGFLTVQVTGYNGASSADPYMLRVETEPPRVTSDVPARTGTGTVGPALPPLPDGFNTVFLVDRQQLEALYGAAGATSVMDALARDQANFTALGYPNVVLSVDRYAAVEDAYAAWNLDPGDPALANAVVRAINGVVDSEIRSQPGGAGLKYLVIVGDDQVIPFARLDDFTVTAGNESTYAGTFARNSDLFASLNAGQMLSDDPYGTVRPVPYLTRQLYVPQLAVGRLVETPDQIVATLDRFGTYNGRLDPQTALTTGYDFLYDGAQGVDAALSGRVGAANAAALLDNPAVPGDSWTKSDLLNAFLPAGGAPSIASLNGHASHYQFEPPGGTDLFTTDDLAASTASVANRLVFSMGCHAGLSVADSIVTADTLDWPEEYADKGVGAYLGNTGYGYGDSLVVAYSEEINKLFAQDIAAGSTVGDVLVAAKQSYFGGLGVFGVYDEKAMAEFTLYGLPMWSVTGPPLAPMRTLDAARKASGASAAAPADPIVHDAATGLDAETFSVDPVNTPVPALTEPQPSGGRYWTGEDGVQVTHLRPVQPKLYVPLTGTTGHGALITELTSTDVQCVDPVFDRPVIDLSANERELPFGDVAFPSKVQTVRTYDTPDGPAQRLILVTGQFFTQQCSPPSPDPQAGVQRLFNHIAGRVFRSTSGDYIAPAFQQIDGTKVGGDTAAFRVDVTDQTPTGTGTLKEVVVAVRAGGAEQWTFVDLTQASPGSSTWTGGLPVSDPQFEYFVQAVDAAGNVAVSTNKGYSFVGTAPAPQSFGVSAELIGPQTNGWFTAAAGLNIDVPTGVTVQASVDGGPFGPPPGSITGDGIHSLDLRTSDGGSASFFVPIDTTPPTITIATPAAGAVYALGEHVQADYTCSDAGSGVATPCAGTVADGALVDTSSPGTKSLTVGAVTDAAGLTSGPQTVTYTVAGPPTAAADSYSTNEDTQLAVSAPGVLGNDHGSVPGDTLTAVLVSGPSHAASFALKADGSFSYLPAANYNGSDSFTYEARDPRGADSSAVTVSITVRPVDDAPTVVVAAGGTCNTDSSGTINLTLADIDSPLGSLTLRASTSNKSVVPDGGIVFAGSGSSRTATITGVTGKSGTATITITVGDGSLSSAVTVTYLAGTAGNDTLTGTSGADLVFGANGSDTISSGGGNDLLCGGNGNDMLNGGADDDTLDGGNGSDLLSGGDGNDVLRGGNGDDTLTGGPGADFFSGGAGNDTNTDFAAAQGDTTNGT